MSQLALHNRPWVVFDPGNNEHRRWYANFVDTGTWGRCPVRFVIPDDHGNLVTMIQRKLVEYYVKQEFKRGGGAKQKC
jgi:hypothetical protein